jgi:hypothetical protein
MSIARNHGLKIAVALATTMVVVDWGRPSCAQGLGLQEDARPSAYVVSEALNDGAFLPLSMGTLPSSHRPSVPASARAFAGYASDRQRALVDVRAEAPLTPWLVLQVRTATDSEATGLRPSVGMRVRLLGESGQHPGLALGAFYKSEGFTEPEGELEGVLAG